MKVCTMCIEEKIPTDFFKDRSKKHGYKSICKKCSKEAVKEYNRRVGYHKIRYGRIKDTERWRHILKKYGITPEQYSAMLKAQNGRCAICGVDNPGCRPFCVDHDHKTEEVRGLLCTPCNQMIGHAKDSPDRLRRGAIYLESIVPQVAEVLIRTMIQVEVAA